MRIDIHYYDNITMLHRDTEVYLHSHDLQYPLRYEDGRISSKGKMYSSGSCEINTHTFVA